MFRLPPVTLLREHQVEDREHSQLGNSHDVVVMSLLMLQVKV